jgi:hypothetical protein
MPVQKLKYFLNLHFILFFSGWWIYQWVYNRLLSSFQALQFNFNRDLTELALVFTSIPKQLLLHPSLYFFIDALLLILFIGICTFFVLKQNVPVWYNIFFTLLFTFYLLLQNIFIQIHLESYVAYVLLSMVFCIIHEKKLFTLISLVRYLFLYVFVSAAIWKIARGAIFNIDQFSQILIYQHVAYLIDGCQSNICAVIHYLIENPKLSYWFYLLATLLELSFVIGFFTKKYDHWLLILAILFFAFDHALMFIPYWQILIAGITLPGFIYPKTWQQSTLYLKSSE